MTPCAGHPSSSPVVVTHCCQCQPASITSCRRCRTQDVNDRRCRPTPTSVTWTTRPGQACLACRLSTATDRRPGQGRQARPLVQRQTGQARTIADMARTGLCCPDRRPGPRACPTRALLLACWLAWLVPVVSLLTACIGRIVAVNYHQPTDSRTAVVPPRQLQQPAC